MDFAAGEILLLDKPAQWTSFDVVNKIRYSLKKKYKTEFKVGHCGTLDPLATGLLLICTGQKTKLAETLSGQNKEYKGTFTLGATTPSFDLETTPEKFSPIPSLTLDELQKIANRFLGESDQLPPQFSAKKVNGKVAYRQARLGKEVELKPQRVCVEAFEITSVNLPSVNFRVRCSKGTYIRSLANDFGKIIGCGAYLSALQRTGSGEYRIEEAISLDQLLQIIQALPE